MQVKKLTRNMTGGSPVKSHNLHPTDMALRVNPELRWYLHLNEPACVVGEHKQLGIFTLEDLLNLIGEVGMEERGDFLPIFDSYGPDWNN